MKSIVIQVIKGVNTIKCTDYKCKATGSTKAKTIQRNLLILLLIF